VSEYQSHHIAHGIVLEGHEWPFIGKGSTDVVEEKMVPSLEPGLYVPELAGFRHPDTVVVRAEGVEWLTYYPRDLASLIVPA
jgi:Xaa-Pro aminopeptidase